MKVGLIVQLDLVRAGSTLPSLAKSSANPVKTLDPHNIANYPAADFTVERIGDLGDCHLSTLLANVSKS